MSESERVRAIGRLKRHRYLANLLTHKYPNEAAAEVAALEADMRALGVRATDIRALKGEP